MVFPEYAKSLYFNKLHSDYSLGSRLFEYLGAGLPIVTTKHKLNGRLIKKFDVGIVLDGHQFHSLESVLATQEHEKYIKNVRNAKRTLNVATRIPQLLKFYKRFSR